MARQEFILCAANHYNDRHVRTDQPKGISSGFVVCGYRHANCENTFAQIVGIPFSSASMRLKDSATKGFLTSKNRFVDRQEAYKIAYAADQIHGPNKGCPTNEIGLTSEDLYYH